MNRTQEIFMYFLGIFMTGKTGERKEILQTDWAGLYETARKQKLELAVYEGIRQAQLLLEIPEQEREKWKKQVQCRQAAEIQKTERFWKLYQALGQEGEHPIVVKGVVCQSLYENPYVRPSADEDLFVEASREQQYLQRLEELGMHRKKAGTEDHFEDRSTGLYLELHREWFAGDDHQASLFNQFFCEAASTTEMWVIRGHEVRTLHPTLHLLYLYLHLVRHFMGTGVGIRQLCDITKFIQRKGTLVQWDFLWQSLVQLRLEKLFSGLLDIGIRYLGLKPEEIGLSEEKWQIAEGEQLLEELLDAGIYGSSSLARLHSSSMTKIFLKEKRRLPWKGPKRLVFYGKRLAVKNKAYRSHPLKSIQIGRKRIRLWKAYGLGPDKDDRHKCVDWRRRWKEWRWIYGYTRAYGRSVRKYFFLSVAEILGGLLGSVASKNLVDQVTGAENGRIFSTAFVMLTVGIAAILVQAYSRQTAAGLTLDIQNDIRADLFEKIVRARWLARTAYHSGDLLNRMENDARAVTQCAAAWLPQLLTYGIQAAAIFALILFYDVTMAWAILLQTPVLLLFSRYRMKKMRSYVQGIREEESRRMAFQEESICQLDMIQSHGLEHFFDSRIRQVQADDAAVQKKYLHFQFRTSIGTALVEMAAGYGCTLWGMYRLWTGHITFGEMTLFLGQAGRLTETIRGMLSLLPSATAAAVSAGRLMEVTEVPQEDAKRAVEREKGQFGMMFQKVSFFYKEEKPVLNNLSLLVSPGTMVAVTGESGQGKTTLVRLLLGLLRPRQGQVLVISSQGETYPAEETERSLFSYVSQGNTLFSGTIAENLRLVRPAAGEEELWKALRKACAEQFVAELPKGIHSRIGERGCGLSEGQSQRIALARAFLRDAPILLLDEATSALDGQTEKQILENVKKTEKTCLVITHRPSVLKQCGEIYEMKEGAVIQWKPQTE